MVDYSEMLLSDTVALVNILRVGAIMLALINQFLLKLFLFSWGRTGRTGKARGLLDFWCGTESHLSSPIHQVSWHYYRTHVQHTEIILCRRITYGLVQHAAITL